MERLDRDRPIGGQIGPASTSFAPMVPMFFAIPSATSPALLAGE
jgi:hypothetical protein